MIIDDLNLIPPAAHKYDVLAQFLEIIAAADGSAVLYSTHNRNVSDLLRGPALSVRGHLLVPMPKFETKSCVEGMIRNRTIRVPQSWWNGMMRGRAPGLSLLIGGEVNRLMERPLDDTERIATLKAAITGNASMLPKVHNGICAFSLMADVKAIDGYETLYRWPPCLLASEAVFGSKDEELSDLLQRPNLNDSKSYEALFALAVYIRLASNERHPLVPVATDVDDSNAFESTSVVYPSASAASLEAALVEMKRLLADKPTSSNKSLRFHNLLSFSRV